MYLVGHSVFLYLLGSRLVLPFLIARQLPARLAFDIFIDIEPHPIGKFFVKKLGKGQKVVYVVVF